jgi:hypothetical protein
MSQLPEGWTMERVRSVAQGPAELLPVDTPSRVSTASSYEALSPTCVISFSGLCLVRDAGDGIWYMGQVDANGTILCWAGHSSDLEEAIRSL